MALVCSSVPHQGHLQAARLCQLWLFKSWMTLYRWHYTQWQFNPICSYRLTPLPVTLVSLRMSSCLSGRGPPRHEKQPKTEQLLCVFVLIKIRAGLQLVAAQYPYCFPRHSPRRAGSGTRSQARGQPLPPRSLQWSLICRLLLAM